MTLTVTKPTVGGSEDSWGTTINTALDTIVNACNGTGNDTLSPNLSTLTINGVGVSADATELSKLNNFAGDSSDLNHAMFLKDSGVTLTEYGVLGGAAGNTVTDGKAVVYGTNGVVGATTVDLGDWTITQSGSSLKFSYQGTVRFALSSNGALTVGNNVTAFGTP